MSVLACLLHGTCYFISDGFCVCVYCYCWIMFCTVWLCSFSGWVFLRNLSSCLLFIINFWLIDVFNQWVFSVVSRECVECFSSPCCLVSDLISSMKWGCNYYGCFREYIVCLHREE